jgi:chondroitin-sulfate-ABC endolyase/exolyase
MKTPAVAWLTAFVLIVAACPPVAAQIGNTAESFEEKVPDHWNASGRSRLSLSDLHYKAGTRSLRWDWASADDTIEVRSDIGPVVAAAKDRATRTFAAWIYCETPHPGKSLRVEFGRADKTDCSFEFHVNYRGWRLALLTYHRDMDGTARDDMNIMRIRPPQGVALGTIFLDSVILNTDYDYRFHARDYQLPNVIVRNNTKLMWQNQLYTEKVAEPADLGRDITPEEREAVKRFEDYFTTASGEPVGDSDMAAARKSFQFWKITETSGQLRGIPLRFRHRENFDGESRLLEKFTQELYTLTLLSRRPFKTQADEAEVRRMILLGLKHMEDQGIARGSGFGTLDHFGYNCRMYTPCLFQARHILKEVKLLGRYGDAAAWYYCRKRVFDEVESTESDIDDFNTLMVPRLQTILLMEDERMKVGYLRSFSAKLNKLLLQRTGSGFHSDGSAHHHGMHYPIYMLDATEHLTPLVRLLCGTPFRIGQDAHQNLKNALLLARIWSNKVTYPISLSGRHPNGHHTIVPEHYYVLALAGSPDGKHKTDPELAAAYLRLVDAKGDKARMLQDQGFRAEADPNGTWVMNQAPSLIIHRRADWSATMRGLSSYYSTTELYARENRFGRYQANGHLEILNHDGNFGSGFRLNGWDWNHFPGTTSLLLPLRVLESPSKSSVYVKGGSGFSGSLHWKAQHGVWAMDMKDITAQPRGFGGRKSAFFFDDRIICLSSSIRSDDAANPCVTTLFQKHLPQPDHETVVDGQSVRSLPFAQRLESKHGVWLTDGWGNGYYVPANQELHVKRSRQVSRDEDDIRDTDGTFALAWVLHGTKPADAGYEYAVLPGGAKRASDFAAQMSNSKTAAYRVLRRDSEAHIVQDVATGIRAAAVFKEQTGRSFDDIVVGVDRPCLFMYRTEGGRMELAVSDPDIALKNDTFIDRPLQLTLAGAWEAADNNLKTTFDHGRTVLTIPCRAGNVFQCDLRAVESKEPRK